MLTYTVLLCWVDRDTDAKKKLDELEMNKQKQKHHRKK